MKPSNELAHCSHRLGLCPDRLWWLHDPCRITGGRGYCTSKSLSLPHHTQLYLPILQICVKVSYSNFLNYYYGNHWSSKANQSIPEQGKNPNGSRNTWRNLCSHIRIHLWPFKSAEAWTAACTTPSDRQMERTTVNNEEETKGTRDKEDQSVSIRRRHEEASPN